MIPLPENPLNYTVIIGVVYLPVFYLGGCIVQFEEHGCL